MKSVLLIDDHPLYSHGVGTILTTQLAMDVKTSGSAQDAINEVKNRDWDLVILDISLPDRNGLDVLKQIKNLKPATPVLVLTIHSEEQYALRVLKAGASGFLTKKANQDILVSAVQKVLEGGRFIAQGLAEKLSKSLAGTMQSAYETLSDREMQVLCMIASGKGVKEIGEELNLSVKTVSTYRARILEKLGKSNNAELIQFAILNRLVPEVPLSGRRYERLSVNFTAIVKNKEVQNSARVWNISLGGVCCESETNLTEGQEVGLVIKESDSSEAVECDARVIWKIEQKFGMLFVNPPEKIKKIIHRWMRNTVHAN